MTAVVVLDRGDWPAPLHAALVAHARAWAEAVAPGHVTVVDGAPGEELAAATRDAFARHGGPVLIVVTGVPRLGPHHAEAARADLASGADASFGPTIQGGWYLAALAAPREELFELAAEIWDGPVVMARTLELSQQLELDVGLLRMERRLASAADIASFRVDPLTPPEVASAL